MSAEHIYSILSSIKNKEHYVKRYVKFICSLQSQKIEESQYYETHHICPKAKDMFPYYEDFSSNKWNSIKLTARQHFIAHWLLYKAYPWSSMAYVFYNFNNGYKTKSSKRNSYKISSRVYENLRLQFSKNVSEKRKGTVIVRDIVTGEKFSASIEQYKTNPNLVHITRGKRFKRNDTSNYKKPKSKEHIEKMVESGRINLVCDIETRKVYRIQHFMVLINKRDGKQRKSPTLREGFANSCKNTPRVCCIKTKKEYRVNDFNRLLKMGKL